MKSVPAAPFRSRRRRYPTRTCASSGSISRFFLTNYYPYPAAIFEWNRGGSPHRTPLTFFCLSSPPDIPLASVCFSFCRPLVPCVIAKNEDFYLLAKIFTNVTKEILEVKYWELLYCIFFIFEYCNDYVLWTFCHFVYVIISD